MVRTQKRRRPLGIAGLRQVADPGLKHPPFGAIRTLQREFWGLLRTATWITFNIAWVEPVPESYRPTAYRM
jgi:hypothetical protein